MKILFVASNSRSSDSLDIGQEITAISAVGSNAIGERPQIVSLAWLPYEKLANAITANNADILHISGHGEERALAFVTADGGRVELTADILNGFLLALPERRRPKLVILNACNTAEIAEKLLTTTPISIGTTGRIENFASVHWITTFYERLFSGANVAEAFDTAHAQLLGIQPDINIHLHTRNDRAAYLILHSAPHLVARFTQVPRRSATKFTFEVGLIGLPPGINQALFMTNDESFEGDEPIELRFTNLHRGNPLPTEIWDDDWPAVWGDIDFFAMGVANAQSHFSVASTLADALRRYYDHKVSI